MPNTNFYPSLSNIISLDKIPALGTFQDGFNNIIEGLFYKNFQSDKSKNGDSAFYLVTIVSFNRIALEIPGTNGLALVLNPSQTLGNTTEVTISVEYHWEIVKYISGFNISSFDFTGKSFFDILFKIANTTFDDFLYKTILTFHIDEIDSIQTFVDTFNANHAPTVLQKLNDPDPIIVIADLINQLNVESIDIFELVSEDYLANDFLKLREGTGNVTDIELYFSNLNILFQNWLGNFSIKDIEKLLIPQLSASINDLSVALEFPRSILSPIDPLTKVAYTDQTIKSQLKFTIGSLKFSTENGLEFEDQSTFSFTKSEIAKTGITIQFTDAKVDISRITNIPEATAAGYSDDFVGVFIGEAEIDLPAKWNHDKTNPSSAVIKGRNLLIGSGGFSGTIGMEGGNGLLKANFGGFAVELDAFSITFLRDSITGSTITGKLKIPGFKDASGADALIAINISFDAKGNFEITAYEKAGIKIKFGDIFSFTMKELSVGKKDDNYYIETSGTLSFKGTAISDVFSDDFELKKLRIWDDGKLEIEGGTFPLPNGGVKIKIGPAKVFITAIHFGSIQRTHGGAVRKYNYFGFDGGLNLNPGGVDARGTGIKYCYTVDKGDFDSYFSIDSFNIDIIIPGSAKPADATVLISGWLSITNETLSAGEGANKKSIDIEVYAGGIDVILPKVKLAAHAAMKYTPDIPAWIIDLGLELPSPIPLGPTGLGIYGFRGLVGQRYVASKEAAKLDEEAKWFDYYKAPPQEGICVQKFQPPFGPNGVSKGFSIGAGVSLATSADGGKAFSCKLFLLLSLPDVIIFEGKANMLSERVGLTSQDPPFFAYLAITSESVETGFGLNYKIPKDTGDILDLYVQMEAAFFFHNPKAWYVNFGTKKDPITARIISFLNGQSYLMLSAMGIEAGASCEFGFKKKYLGGTLSAELEAYIRMSGHISFHRPQIGAQASVGGSVDVRIFGCSFYLGFDCSLGVEVPHPFYVEGRATIEVRVKILFKKVSKKFTVEIRWEKSKDTPNDPIYPLEYNALSQSVKAINIMSNETFDIIYIDNKATIKVIDLSDIGDVIIPMDSYIDIEFSKPLNPGNVMDKIGGVGTVGEDYKESIPPKKIKYQSSHSYSIDAISVYIWDANKISDAVTGKWTEYFPYQAMITADAIPADNSQLKQLGQWQIQSEGIYNRIRLLAQSVFSYMDPGLKGWCNPRQYGITPSSLFCVGLTPDAQLANWNDFAADTVITKGSLISKKNPAQLLHYKMISGSAIIQHKNNNYSINESLFISNESRLRLQLSESSAYVSLKLFSYSKSVEISYYRMETIGFIKIMRLIKKDTKSRYSLLNPVVYKDPQNPVDYVYIEPVHVNATTIASNQAQINDLTASLYECPVEDEVAILAQINQLNQNIADEEANAYDGNTLDTSAIQQQIAELTQLLNNLISSREHELSEAARLNQLYETAKAKMDSCCNIMMSPPQSSERLSCINSLGDIVPNGVSLDEVELDYNAYLNSLQTLSDGVAACRISYSANVSDLCNNAHTYLNDTKTKSEDHTKTAQTIGDEIDTVLTNINELNTVLANTQPETLPSSVSANSTILHEVEWMSIKDYQLSEEQPGKEAVQASYQNTVQAVQDSLAPVWRPNETYLLSITISDTLSTGAASKTMFFGFKTARPVGFFHLDYDFHKINNADKYAPETPGLPPDNIPAIQLNRYKLTTLRDYIDYVRSYPNADGSILNAKPLYYKDTELNLFYKKSYVYHLFSNWPTYGALSELTGMLEVIVKDPIEDIEIANPLPPNVVSTTIPKSIVGWKKDDDVPAPKSISVWDIMRNPELYNPDFQTPDGGYCWEKGGRKIRPAWVSTSVTFNFLSPSKLYTAIFYNNFEGERKEVHRYVFQTSRYANLADQILSYWMEDEYKNLKEALYDLPLSITPAMLSQISSLLTVKKTGDSYLDSNFINPFDCLMEGVLKMNPLPPALNTEVNKVINTETGKIIGLLIRNPEPFINPKLPDEEKAKFCSIFEMNSMVSMVSGKNPCIFSKDCSQIFITGISGLELSMKYIRLQFDSRMWNGNAYVSDPNNQYITSTITLY